MYRQGRGEESYREAVALDFFEEVVGRWVGLDVLKHSF